MQTMNARGPADKTCYSPGASQAWTLAIAAMTCVGFQSTAQAQGSKHGAYTGTVTVSGTEMGKYTNGSFRANIKITLPLTSASTSSAMAEISDIDKPSAMASILQWDTAGKDSSPDSGGKINTWTCSLAAPTDVPMNVQGTLNLNYRAKTHSMYFALVSMKEVPFNCRHSRSGPYRKTGAVSLFFGTSEPDVLPWKELPYADAARLKATYKLLPVSAMKGQYGPLDQEWDLQLKR